MKRIAATLLSLTLALGLLAGAAGPARAADQEEVLQVLALLGVLNGDENGDLNLSGPVTRAQFAKMCVAASPLRDQGRYPSGLSPFPDVPAGHWAAGYITAARDAGWFAGDLDGRFRPNDGVTLAEAATVALRMLGYEEDFTGQWPSSQMRLCAALDLDRGISAASGDRLTRMECGQLIYNTLSAPTKTGEVYCASMGYSLNMEGDIDSLALMTQELEGPVVLTGGSVAAAVGFSPRQLYLDGREAQASEVPPYSVLYHQADASVVFAYTTRHTGAVTAVSPDADSPAAVTVGGVTYTLGTSQAAVSLSSQGEFQVGDRVTLLMGRGNTVAAVVAAEDLSQVLYGVVTAVTPLTYTTAAGVQYQAAAADIIATDGATYRCETDLTSLEAGDLVSVDYSGGGVRRLTERGISGAVGAASIGGTAVAEDAEILDVWEGSALAVSLDRLRGCTLSSSDVRFVAYDGEGRISHLILDDFTGDLYQYGLLTDSETTPTGQMTFVSTYTLLLNGTETTLTFENTSFAAEGGGVQVRYQDGLPDKLYGLEDLSVRSAGGDWVSSGTRRHTLADTVPVYVRQGGEWYLSDWSLVRDTEAYSLTAWYDRADDQGGRVRLITAVPRSG